MGSCASIGKDLAALLAIIVFAAVVMAPEKPREGFELRPMDVAAAAEPLLPDYLSREKPGLTDNDAQDIFKNYPVFPADSCLNNNIEYWRRPTNGKCTPADFCDSLYEDTPQNIPGEPCRPPLYGVVRVNYYASRE